MLQDIEMPAHSALPDVKRRLLVNKHKRTVDMENRTVTLDLAVLHYRTVQRSEPAPEVDGKPMPPITVNDEVPLSYIGKGNGLRRFRLVATDRTLVDARTGLNATPDGTNDPYLMPEFSYLLSALSSGVTEAQLVQSICQRNVQRNNFDTDVYEILE
ncbi:hypothetical protein [Tellurirhabdus rosea]|uniref:hypothetical protein n=1 Tax=Tellurirhabdus rosea TaxID=2674997 RepID=UPI002250E625|nr:hypothetical protein [Tellurirhabdus rosea]